jgi:hypothetical protein
MELKVVCNCGQKYKFDVEPVDNRMPVTVSCPACGADGTPTANALLAYSTTSNSPPAQPQAQARVTARVVTRPVAAPAAAPAKKSGGTFWARFWRRV